MLPSNPIPAVCDYGSAALYRELPNEEQIRAGVVPLDSLPAAWWNCMWFATNQAVNCARYTAGALIDEINTVLTRAGVCVCDTCVDQLYTAIENIRTTIGNASVAGAVKSSTCPGEVSINAQGIMTANCVGNAAALTTTARTLTGAINELKQTYDSSIGNLETAVSALNTNKAPVNHLSDQTTYGVGNAGCYGHVKLSDTYNACVGGAPEGIAASQKALFDAYDYLINNVGAPLGNTVGCAPGTAAAGTCNTAARSDHVHPNPYMLIDRDTGCCTVQAERGNELNFYSYGAWINYRGGNNLLCVGDGAGKGEYGTVLARCFCGTATNATNATNATSAAIANIANIARQSMSVSGDNVSSSRTPGRVYAINGSTICNDRDERVMVVTRVNIGYGPYFAGATVIGPHSTASVLNFADGGDFWYALN